MTRSAVLAQALSIFTLFAGPAWAREVHPPLAPIGNTTSYDAGFSLDLGGGAHQHLVYASPKRPRGTIVMLPGGSGDVRVERNGDVRLDDNFVVRTQPMWTARGYAVVIPDTIDRANLRGLRSSAGYGDIVARLVAFAHSRASGPVYLLGTSQGSIAAMNGAAHAPLGSVAGLVLTESVSVRGGSHETVFDADPQDVYVPALVVANRDDTCPVAPPANAARIASAMSRSHDVRIAYVNGGQTLSDNACGSRTPHGYFGIETGVVDLISAWLRAHG